MKNQRKDRKSEVQENNHIKDDIVAFRCRNAGSTHFQPETGCIKGQVAAFMYRACGN